MSNRSAELAKRLPKRKDYIAKCRKWDAEEAANDPPALGCDTLENYLAEYAPALAQQAQAACKPLHTPGTDPLLPMPLLREPYEAQAHVISAGIKALDRQAGLIVSGEMGVGKGGLPSTRVLTPNGWTTLGEIKVGDEIIDPEGGTTTVTGKFERGVMPMFSVTFCDGSSTVCSGDHLWLVNSPLRKWKDKPRRVLQLSEIEKQGLTHKNGNRQHFIPLVEPVEFRPTRIPTHPYLLGYLLGNACLTQKTIYVCAPDEETVKRLASMLPADASLKLASRRIDYRISGGNGRLGNSLLTQLKKLGLMGCGSDRKFIPQSYLFANRASRVFLLQGLLDSDGCVAGDNGTGVEYSTASPRLAAQVIELVQSLGGTATRQLKSSPAYSYKGEQRVGQPSHRIYIVLPPTIQPFALSRKADAYKPRTKYLGPTRSIVSIVPVGEDECICISVASKNNLYVTDDYIVTHNSLIMAAICQGHSHDRGYRALVFCPPHLVFKWEREIRNTLTNAHVHHLRSYHDVAKVMRDAKPVGRGWWIVSSTRAKMGAKWKPAFNRAQRGMTLYCPDCHQPLTRYDLKLQMDVTITETELEKKKHFCTNSVEGPDAGASLRPCGAPLWTWTHEIDRWPIAAFIHKKLPGWFDYVIIDESHQAKAAETAIGQAVGSLAAGCKRTICGTGTVFGGYAWHVRPILYRIAPASLIAEGLGWTDEMKFNERYGRLERRVTETSTGGRDNRQSKGTTTKTAKYVRPGVMPTLFGKHLIGNCLSGDTRFLTRNGIRALRDCVNQEIKVLNRHGWWEAATVREFATKQLYRITFSNGTSVEATADHLWWQADGTRVDTMHLKSVPFTAVEEFPTCDPVAIRHGIIYGDGHAVKHCKTKEPRYIAIQFVNPAKDEHLVSYFTDEVLEVATGPKNRRRGSLSVRTVRSTKKGTCVSLQPLHFKTLPDVSDCTPEYARGFIAGLIATDGNVPITGSVCISASKTAYGDDIGKKISELAVLGGCVVNGEFCFVNSSKSYGPGNSTVSVRIKPFSAPIILPSHKQRRDRRSIVKVKMCLKVVSVEPTTVEPTFCCVVPGSNSFTLANGLMTSNSIFLSLDEVAEALPKLEETVLPVDMDHETRAAYDEIETAITAEIKQMLARKDKRLLAKMLHVLLGYPDHPYDWKEIGYFDNDEDGNQFWRHVVTPKNLIRTKLRPKELALIELVKSEVSQGRKCWVYSVMTDARDVNERLRSILADSGLRVEILRSSVPTDEREEWIAKHAPACDAIISHPQLVETGLDFFAKQEGGYSYNIPTIIGYSWGYSTFTMRQAGRRHWRIGQSEVCRTFHPHYAESMQARALSLMGRKLVASTSIEGKFSSEGLAALAGDEGTLETALAKSLVERLDDTDVGRVWAKLGGAPVKDVHKLEAEYTAALAAINEPAEFELPPPKHVFQSQLSF